MSSWTHDPWPCPVPLVAVWCLHTHPSPLPTVTFLINLGTPRFLTCELGSPSPACGGASTPPPRLPARKSCRIFHTPPDDSALLFQKQGSGRPLQAPGGGSRRWEGRGAAEGVLPPPPPPGLQARGPRSRPLAQEESAGTGPEGRSRGPGVRWGVGTPGGGPVLTHSPPLVPPTRSAWGSSCTGGASLSWALRSAHP